MLVAMVIVLFLLLMWVIVVVNDNEDRSCGYPSDGGRCSDDWLYEWLYVVIVDCNGCNIGVNNSGKND